MMANARTLLQARPSGFVGERVVAADWGLVGTFARLGMPFRCLVPARGFSSSPSLSSCLTLSMVNETPIILFAVSRCFTPAGVSCIMPGGIGRPVVSVLPTVLKELSVRKVDSCRGKASLTSGVMLAMTERCSSPSSASLWCAEELSLCCD